MASSEARKIQIDLQDLILDTPVEATYLPRDYKPTTELVIAEQNKSGWLTTGKWRKPKHPVSTHTRDLDTYKWSEFVKEYGETVAEVIRRRDLKTDAPIRQLLEETPSRLIIARLKFGTGGLGTEAKPRTNPNGAESVQVFLFWTGRLEKTLYEQLRENPSSIVENSIVISPKTTSNHVMSSTVKLSETVKAQNESRRFYDGLVNKYGSAKTWSPDVLKGKNFEEDTKEYFFVNGLKGVPLAFPLIDYVSITLRSRTYIGTSHTDRINRLSLLDGPSFLLSMATPFSSGIEGRVGVHKVYFHGSRDFRRSDLLKDGEVVSATSPESRLINIEVKEIKSILDRIKISEEIIGDREYDAAHLLRDFPSTQMVGQGPIRALDKLMDQITEQIVNKMIRENSPISQMEGIINSREKLDGPEKITISDFFKILDKTGAEKQIFEMREKLSQFDLEYEKISTELLSEIFVASKLLFEYVSTNTLPHIRRDTSNSNILEKLDSLKKEIKELENTISKMDRHQQRDSQGEISRNMSHAKLVVSLTKSALELFSEQNNNIIPATDANAQALAQRIDSVLTGSTAVVSMSGGTINMIRNHLSSLTEVFKAISLEHLNHILRERQKRLIIEDVVSQ